MRKALFLGLVVTVGFVGPAWAATVFDFACPWTGEVGTNKFSSSAEVRFWVDASGALQGEAQRVNPFTGPFVQKVIRSELKGDTLKVVLRITQDADPRGIGNESWWALTRKGNILSGEGNSANARLWPKLTRSGECQPQLVQVPSPVVAAN